MRVLVCGGRHYKDKDALWIALDRLHEIEQITYLTHGDAKGADRLAGKWAKDRKVKVKPYPIEKGEDGFARNERMLKDSLPQLCIHFPGGAGTADMRRRAHV